LAFLWLPGSRFWIIAPSFGFLAFLCGAIVLILVLFLGETIRGTRGWFQIGSLSFQPVELAKLSLILYVGALFSRMSHGRLTWRIFGMSGCATMTYVGLVLLQPDFGSAMVMLGSGSLVLFWPSMDHLCVALWQADSFDWRQNISTRAYRGVLSADPHGAG
jgi:cell division protein FtsW (lipid II flippase)